MLRSKTRILKLWLAALVSLVCAFCALAGGFSLTIGKAVAGNDFHSKGAVLVVRPDGCGEPAKALIRGTAEGMVNGTRRSLPLKLTPLPTPGVYAVYREWPAEGVWVVNLTGNYNGATASSIVPIGPKGLVRESVKSFQHSATEEEIDVSLKALADGQEANSPGRP